MTWLIAVPIAYLVGSIPTAYLIGRIIKGIDIREVGDGNVGAANAYREIGPAAGIFVMLFDLFKGSLVILVSRNFLKEQFLLAVGLAVVVGHIFPLFLKFKGGRGEATVGGVLLALMPVEALILLAIAIIPFIITRNTLLLGLLVYTPFWLVAWLFGEPFYLIVFSIVLPCVVGLALLSPPVI
jgi:glycerol-3-phosphate acyltransferase PlsY